MKKLSKIAPLMLAAGIGVFSGCEINMLPAAEQSGFETAVTSKGAALAAYRAMVSELGADSRAITAFLRDIKKNKKYYNEKYDSSFRELTVRQQAFSDECDMCLIKDEYIPTAYTNLSLLAGISSSSMSANINGTTISDHSAITDAPDPAARQKQGLLAVGNALQELGFYQINETKATKNSLKNAVAAVNAVLGTNISADSPAIQSSLTDLYSALLPFSGMYNSVRNDTGNYGKENIFDLLAGQQLEVGKFGGKLEVIKNRGFDISFGGGISAAPEYSTRPLRTIQGADFSTPPAHPTRTRPITDEAEM